MPYHWPGLHLRGKLQTEGPAVLPASHSLEGISTPDQIRGVFCTEVSAGSAAHGALGSISAMTCSVISHPEVKILPSLSWLFLAPFTEARSEGSQPLAFPS